MLEEASSAGATAAADAAGGGEREGSAGPGPLPATASGEAPAKKRRTRWEPADENAAKVALLDFGGAITLPPSLAGLVDLNPETRALQLELNQVGAGSRW